MKQPTQSTEAPFLARVHEVAAQVGATWTPDPVKVERFMARARVPRQCFMPCPTDQCDCIAGGEDGK